MYFSASKKAFVNSPIWKDCVEITKERHNTILARLNHGYILTADARGFPITVAPLTTPEESIADLLKKKLRQLESDHDKVSTMIRGKYTLVEAMTWTSQILEARDYDTWIRNGRVGSPPKTPFVSLLDLERASAGIPGGMDDLVATIIGNDAVYSKAVAVLNVKYQIYKAQLQAIRVTGNKGTLEAYKWDLVKDVLGTIN